MLLTPEDAAIMGRLRGAASIACLNERVTRADYRQMLEMVRSAPTMRLTGFTRAHIARAAAYVHEHSPVSELHTFSYGM